MAEPNRISPEETKQKVASGSALLVCAYEDEEKFKLLHLDGAISHAELKLRLHSLHKDYEIIFY